MPVDRSIAPKFDRVFIVTYGRSGSTLLQSLLNAIQGFRVYGENAGFLRKIQNAYNALLEANHNLPNPEGDNESRPWFGASRFNEEFVTSNFRQFINRILFQPHASPNIRVFGFKEIRFNEMPHDQILDYIKFVRTIFPNAAIVFNTRNVSDVLKSGWWRNSYWPGLPKQLTDFGIFASEYATKNPDHAIHVSYDALIQPDRLEVMRLLDFFGATLSQAAIESVFSGNHSYENRSLTAYITGRVGFIKIVNEPWWRENVAEFRVEVSRQVAGGYRLTGALVSARKDDAALFLRVGTRSVQLVGSLATPKIGEMFPGDPRATHAGFVVETPDDPEIHLFTVDDDNSPVSLGKILPLVALEKQRAAPKVMARGEGPKR